MIPEVFMGIKRQSGLLSMCMNVRKKALSQEGMKNKKATPPRKERKRKEDKQVMIKERIFKKMPEVREFFEKDESWPLHEFFRMNEGIFEFILESIEPLYVGEKTGHNEKHMWTVVSNAILLSFTVCDRISNRVETLKGLSGEGKLGPAEKTELAELEKILEDDWDWAIIILAAAAHDAACRQHGREDHERWSGMMVPGFDYVWEAFSPEEITLIMRLIWGHRASKSSGVDTTRNDIMSLYQMILNDSDKIMNPLAVERHPDEFDAYLERTYNYNNTRYENGIGRKSVAFSAEDAWNDRIKWVSTEMINALNRKYGKEGYAKVYLPESESWFKWFKSQVSDDPDAFNERVRMFVADRMIAEKEPAGDCGTDPDGKWDKIG
jgi:hypothetical protein